MLEKPTQEQKAPAPVQRLPENRNNIKSASDATVVRAHPVDDEQSSPERRSIITPDVVFKGELIAGDEIVIEGQVEGMISRHTRSVIVGKQGRVKAEIHAATVRIEGRVDGNVYGDELVELLAGANVHGDIVCSCVHIAKGALFNGAIRMA